MSIYDGVQDSNPSAERLPPLTQGEYLLEILANKEINTREKGVALLREFKVLEATKIADDEEPTPVGTEAKAKLIVMNEKYAKDRLAEYVRGATNAKADPQLCEAIFGEKNPLKGKHIRVRVKSDTSKRGNSYLKYEWRFVDDGFTTKNRTAK